MEVWSELKYAGANGRPSGRGPQRAFAQPVLPQDSHTMLITYWRKFSVRWRFFGEKRQPNAPITPVQKVWRSHEIHSYFHCAVSVLPHFRGHGPNGWTGRVW